MSEVCVIVYQTTSLYRIHEHLLGRRQFWDSRRILVRAYSAGEFSKRIFLYLSKKLFTCGQCYFPHLFHAVANLFWARMKNVTLLNGEGLLVTLIGNRPIPITSDWWLSINHFWLVNFYQSLLIREFLSITSDWYWCIPIRRILLSVTNTN